MSFDVYIKRIADGEVRIVHEDGLWFSDEASDIFGLEYLWTEGNYSCDCNRQLFFERVNDKTYDADDDLNCGDRTYRIEVRSPEGLVLYSEWEATRKTEAQD